MENNSYKEYLSIWSNFLKELINKENVEFGLKIKYQRQLQVMSDILNAAPFNISLFKLFLDIYNNNHQYIPVIENGSNVPTNISKFFISHFNTSTENSGKIAIKKALQSENLFLIQGPPGTGKTSVIAEITAQVLAKDNDARIAIVSETHVAVDNALEKIIEIIDGEKHKILRYPHFKYSSSKFDVFEFKSYIKEYEEYLSTNYRELSYEIIKILELDSLIDEDDPEDYIKTKWIHKIILENISVLGITCNHLGRFYLEFGDKPWDLVIIDEVSKATLPEIFIASSNAKKVILVGDPKQLPPVFCKEEIEITESMGIDSDELMNNNLVDKLYEACPENMKAFLNTQYRMTNEIGTLISHQFYDKMLLNGRNVSNPHSIKWLDSSVSVRVPVKNTSQGGILKNYFEANLIKNQLEILEEEFPPDTQIAIITPYKAQKYHLISVLENSKFKNIQIDTVDAFQGREARIVFFSVTRNHGSIRFFSDTRRLNVALSRSIDYFYLVGSYDYLKRIEFFRKLKDASKQRAD
ncbi:MAG: AAA family ATPase [Labilibaculum sp.]|nr:AAA family ATPase [Labilibaculum sp.]